MYIGIFPIFFRKDQRNPSRSIYRSSHGNPMGSSCVLVQQKTFLKGQGLAMRGARIFGTVDGSFEIRRSLTS